MKLIRERQALKKKVSIVIVLYVLALHVKLIVSFPYFHRGNRKDSVFAMKKMIPLIFYVSKFWE